ncbi:putative cell cycle checkpoint [Paratrimastix pyriformis]|uniref:Checkpoint protein n=1 Tax=Paratrimastix pyriformis TaxID=342808 RepID=A0ABQ8UCU4_9EUKA|nr:putative cell cycle checkpoint [Paratrimastix pyriformis]
MRFKTTISNVPYFLKLLQAIEKIGKDIILGLSPEKLRIFLVPDQSGIKVWSELNMDTLFRNTSIESRSKNCIYIEADLGNLMHILKSNAKSQEVTVKLCKKDGLPFLTFRITPKEDVSITQDVAVAVLSDEDFRRLIDPPTSDTADVQICLPSLRSFHDIVDRYKALGTQLAVVANMDGRLSIRMETPMVTLATFYQGLTHPPLAGQGPPARDPDRRAEVRVDIRKFVQVLRSHMLFPSNVIACLFSGRALAIHLLLDDLYMTYLIPALADTS